MKKIIALLLFLSIHLPSLAADKQSENYKAIIGNGAISALFTGGSYIILRSSKEIVFSESPLLTTPSPSALNLGLLTAGVTCACLATYSAWKTCESIKQTFIIK